MTNTNKFMWYFDSVSRQNQFNQKGPRTDNQTWTHKGHLKGIIKTGHLNQVHKNSIEEMVNQNIGVPSIQAGLLAKFGMNFSDQQIYHAIRSMGYNVTDDGLIKLSVASARTQENDATTMLRNFGRLKDVTMSVLCENMETSTENNQVFETYIKGFGTSDLTDLEMVDCDYDGTDCCRKSAPPKQGMAARDGEEYVHGRVYDKDRIVTINGQRMFCISVVSIHRRELRNFQAYPEVLVMDDKKKTNKHGHSFFAGVGVDSLWRNNTLFRSWTPNNTHDALNWLMTVALVHLLSPRLRSRIKCVFTDHCGTMTPILAKVCGDKDVFPNARHFLCVYHIVRNFFQEFGQGHKKQWKLKSSTQQYRKGGTIQWAYAWQKNCASAIFRLAVCETKEEFDACKEHLLQYVKRSKDMGSSKTCLRDSVLQFFAQKFLDADKWCLYNRLDTRTLGIASTSRAEGEFSGIRVLNLNAATGFNRAMMKIQWQANRRHNRKVYLSQQSMNSVIKRQSAHCMDVDEWKWLDKKLTTHYLKQVESQMEMSSRFVYQVVKVTKVGDVVTGATIAVWVPNAEFEDNADIESEVDGEGANSENGEADEENGDTVEPSHGDEMEDSSSSGSEGLEAEEKLGEDPEAPDEIVTGVTKNEDDDQWSPFLWKKVRFVEVSVGQKCTFSCDCKLLERECYACRHILHLLKAMHGNSFGLVDQALAARLSKSRCWGVFHSAKTIPIDDAVPLPTVSRQVFDTWMNVQPDPTSVGVPSVGFISTGDDNGDLGGCDDAAGEDQSAPKRKKSREQKLLAITLGRLQDNHFEFVERCKHDKHFAADYLQLQEDLKRQYANRKQPSRPGRKKLDRVRGAADVPKRKRRERIEDHSGKRDKRARVDVSDFGGDPVLQLRDRILRKGLKSGDYVQIHNSKGEKWFMRIVNGKVLEKNTADPVLASALWCEPNDVTKLSAKFKTAETCEIRSIIDAGDMSKFRQK